HDALTDLPNRSRLIHQLLATLPEARRGGERMAVLSLDLDRFTVINDSLGHRAGDEVLCALADRLHRSLRPGDTVGRLGGDEFVLLLRGVGSEAELVRTAETLLAVVRVPFLIGGREVHVSASLGASRFPEDGADPEELLKRAEVAMYQAKEQGRGPYQIYAPTMDAHNLEQLSLENDLRKALVNREFVLFYQPVLNCHTRGVDSVEALLRWRHPRLGLLRPGQFLWLAEAAGLTDAVDLWVLRTACRQMVAWQADGVPRLRVAVNLSARPFQRRDLLERVKEVLAETTLQPSSLEIEITETLAMQNAEASLAVLRGLKELGVRISIDDFGTGYSSLSYLTNFPIDTLKVDASFVRSLGGDSGSEEVVAAVIALAHSLDIDVVAEGVEEELQWQVLRELGCDKVQGYLFSHPLPADECRQLALEGDAQRELLPAG
ncbi:MAG TPA: EAL domain-containing protein, partial [Thermoanaerobaculia bacterium]